MKRYKFFSILHCNFGELLANIFSVKQDQQDEINLEHLLLKSDPDLFIQVSSKPSRDSNQLSLMAVENQLFPLIKIFSYHFKDFIVIRIDLCQDLLS